MSWRRTRQVERLSSLLIKRCTQLQRRDPNCIANGDVVTLRNTEKFLSWIELHVFGLVIRRLPAATVWLNVLLARLMIKSRVGLQI